MSRFPKAITRKTVIGILFIAAAVVLGFFVPRHISIAITPSVEKTLFFITEKGSVTQVAKGDYVNIDLFEVLAGKRGGQYDEVRKIIEQFKTRLLTKEVLCVSGQRIVTKGNDYFCDFVFIGTAKDKTLHGTPTIKKQYDEIIPPGYFFAGGSHKDSFDSKYFGLVKISNVKSKLIPII